MNSKPIVMEHLLTTYISFVIDFSFSSNITILTGESGSGRTICFSAIRECMATNPNILCFNYLDYLQDIKSILIHTSGKLIVIDNADILLTDDTRNYISLDNQNQYLIIGRNPQNLFTTRQNLYELVSYQEGDQTSFMLQNYL